MCVPNALARSAFALAERAPRSYSHSLLNYKLHRDQELFDKAYRYIKQYY